MVRIKVWADTHSTGVIAEIGEYLFQEETTISDNTWANLQKWVDDYDFIIPLSEEDRKMYQVQIKELDIRGLALLRQIRSEWTRDPKTDEEIELLYFSEGLQKYLSIDGEIVIQ